MAMRDDKPIEMTEIYPGRWIPEATLNWHKATIQKIRIGVICATWLLIGLMFVVFDVR